MPLNYGAYTACLGDRPLAAALDVLKEAGLTGAEIMRRAEATLNEAGSLSTPGPLAPKAGADSSSTTGRRPSVQELLEHEAACDSCWSLDDAAGHLGLPSGAAAALAAEGVA